MIEFLDPIPPGLGKDEFLARLETAIETNTARLLDEGRAWDKARGGAPAPVSVS